MQNAGAGARAGGDIVIAPDNAFRSLVGDRSRKLYTLMANDVMLPRLITAIHQEGNRVPLSGDDARGSIVELRYMRVTALVSTQ